MNDGSSASSYHHESEEDSDEKPGSQTLSASHRITNSQARVQNDAATTVEKNKNGVARRGRGDRSKTSQLERDLTAIRAGGRVNSRHYLSAGYRDLLNSVIADVKGETEEDFQHQSSSQIGASLWSNEEKDRFFSAVASKGIGDLAAIAERIGTKSEAEVQSYASLLRRGIETQDDRSVTRSPVLAAREISDDCEKILNLAADALAKLVDQRDAEMERERWKVNVRGSPQEEPWQQGGREQIGPDGSWLIDENVAERMDAEFEDNEMAPTNDPNGLSDHSSASDPTGYADGKPVSSSNTSADYTPSNDSDYKAVGNPDALTDHKPANHPNVVGDHEPASAEGKPRIAAKHAPTSSGKVDAGDDEETTYAQGAHRTERFSLTPAMELLRPTAFLELSANLFMNNDSEPDLNWHKLKHLDDYAESPAMFRSAFDDFCALTKSLTRRLVQVSMIQATSRLRAEDCMRADWSPVAEVRQIDVQTAVDVLGMKVDRKKYWATAARRCKVGVTTKSKRYKDGRPRPVLGYRLTYDEVETELGLDPAPADRGLDDPELDQVHDVDVWEAIDDPNLDILTDRSVSPRPSASPSPSPDRDPGTPSSSLGRKRKRKRILSASAVNAEETKYLESMDQQASIEETRRLWRVMHLSPPGGITRGRGNERVQAESGSRTWIRDRHLDWRERTEYSALWEQPEPIGPDEASFRDMERSGKRARKRRKMLYEKVAERLEQSEVDENEETDSDEEGEEDEMAEGGSSDGEEVEGSDARRKVSVEL